MKDIIIGVLVLITIFNTAFIYCCLKVNDEYDEVEDDYKPSKNRKRKTNK